MFVHEGHQELSQVLPDHHIVGGVGRPIVDVREARAHGIVHKQQVDVLDPARVANLQLRVQRPDQLEVAEAGGAGARSALQPQHQWLRFGLLDGHVVTSGEVSRIVEPVEGVSIGSDGDVATGGLAVHVETIDRVREHNRQQYDRQRLHCGTILTKWTCSIDRFGFMWERLL